MFCDLGSTRSKTGYYSNANALTPIFMNAMTPRSIDVTTPEFIYKNQLPQLPIISQLQALGRDRSKMSTSLLVLVVCASLANCLPQYENNGRNVLTPGNIPGLVPGSPAAAAWWTAQIAHRGKRQVSVEGSPEQVAYRNAELAFVAPSTAFYAPAQKQQFWQHHQNIHQQNTANFLARQRDMIHQQNALNFINSGAGRRKRHVSIVGSPEWQEWQNAQLAWIAPSIGPLASLGRNFAQEQLNFVGPAPGPNPDVNYAQSALNFVAPAPEV